MRSSSRDTLATDASRAATLWPSHVANASLHFITGKGGVGKTTLSGALALALASSGRKVLLVEVEGRQSVAHYFQRAPLPYAETKVASAENDGEVWALAIDVESAIFEYFEMFYNLGFAAKAMRALGAVEFITTVAPGLDDVVLTGKIYEIATRTRKSGKRSTLGKPPTSGTQCYDAIVVDSPPTGRVDKFLQSARSLGEMTKGGPVCRHANNVASVLQSTGTVIHIATLLEALPVQETLEAADVLEKNGFHVGALLVNRSPQQFLAEEPLREAAEGQVDAALLKSGLQTLGVDLAHADVAGLITETIDHAVTLTRQQEQVHTLSQSSLPCIPLPLLAQGVDLGGLYELASHLHQVGV